MRKFLLFASFFILLLSLFQCVHGKSRADVPTWKAGVAATVITPREPVWMGGYSSRTRPTGEKIHDLWAKALYLEDTRKRGSLIITCDLVGLSKSVSDRIKDELLEKTGLSKAQIILNCSHTHSGPVTSGNLINIYPIDSENLAKENIWVFILAGQSNMAGRGKVEPIDTVPDSRIFTINKEGELLLAKEPLHFYEPTATGLDCGLSFGKELLKHKI